MRSAEPAGDERSVSWLPLWSCWRRNVSVSSVVGAPALLLPRPGWETCLPPEHGCQGSLRAGRGRWSPCLLSALACAGSPVEKMLSLPGAVNSPACCQVPCGVSCCRRARSFFRIPLGRHSHRPFMKGHALGFFIYTVRGCRDAPQLVSCRPSGCRTLS